MNAKFISYFIFLLLIVFYGLSQFRQLNKELRLIFFLVCCVLLSELSSRVVSHFVHTSMPTYHFLLPLQLLLYMIIYLKILPLKVSQKKIVKVLLLLALSFSIINSIFLQTLKLFPSNTLLLLSIILVSFSLIHFYWMIQKPSEVSPIKESVFWFSAGNLFFFCITFFIFGFLNPMLKLNGGVPRWMYDVIFIANILLYGSYMISLWLGVNKNKLSS